MSHVPQKKGKPIGRRRQLSVRAVRRTHPDTERLSRTLLDFALQQAAAEAAAQADAKRRRESADD